MNKFLFLIFLISCSGEDRPQRPLFFPPDTGTDFEENELPQTEPECDGQFDGESCELPNAAGVCADGKCQVVACESPNLNCDNTSTNGCETVGNTESDCGVCGLQCATSQICQLGSSYVCAEGVVCQPDRYDLDGDRENGCEWRAIWGPILNSVPNDLVVDAATKVPHSFMVVGTSAAGTFLSTPNAVPQAVSLTLGPSAGAAVSVVGRPDDWIIAWQRGISVGDTVAGIYSDDRCVGPRQNVDMIGDASDYYLGSQNDVVHVVGGVEIARLGLAGYLRSFFAFADPTTLTVAVGDRGDVFDLADSAECECLFDLVTGEDAVDPRCLGQVVCQDSSFDSSSCGACIPSPINCPDFSVRGLQRFGNEIAVFTRLGVVVVDLDLQPLRRVENSPTIGIAGGGGFSGGFVDDMFTLFDATGAITSFELDSQTVSVASDPHPTAPWTRVVGSRAVESRGTWVGVGETDVELGTVRSSTVIDVSTAPTPSPVRRPVTVWNGDTFDVWFQYQGGFVNLTLSP